MCSSRSSHYVFIFKRHLSKSSQISNSKNIIPLSLALSGISILMRISLYVCLMPTYYERNCNTNLTPMLCQIDGNLYCGGKYSRLMDILNKLMRISSRNKEMFKCDTRTGLTAHSSTNAIQYCFFFFCLFGFFFLTGWLILA